MFERINVMEKSATLMSAKKRCCLLRETAIKFGSSIIFWYIAIVRVEERDWLDLTDF